MAASSRLAASRRRITRSSPASASASASALTASPYSVWPTSSCWTPRAMNGVPNTSGCIHISCVSGAPRRAEIAGMDMYSSTSTAIRGCTAIQSSGSKRTSSHQAAMPKVEARPSRLSSGHALNQATATMAALRIV